jgi:glycosyltransferase involved in cell wall biosynthesis
MGVRETEFPSPLREDPSREGLRELDALSASGVREGLTVVLPTLNEEEGVGLVMDELREEGYTNILVVDGYSTDRTVEIAKEKGAEVILQRGNGKGGALKTAIDHVSTPYILVMDADHTYDPRDIERFLAESQGCDQVIGMRSNRENIPWVHRFGNHVLSWSLSLLMGHKVNDPCSGMYLLRTEKAKGLELTSSGFDVEAEITGQLSAQGRVREVPITYRERRGEGKLRAWADGFRILLTIVKTMWLFNPVFLFSSLAALATVPGVFILLQQLTIRYFYGTVGWSEGWTWLGLVLLTMGLQGVTVSTISLLLRRMERRIIDYERRETYDRFPSTP